MILWNRYKFKNQMKRLQIFFVSLLLCLPVVAGTYNPTNIPIPQNGTAPSYISNPDSILSDSICAVINTCLFKLEDSTTVKSLVMVVEKIEGDDPYKFSMEVGNSYGIGTRDNKGFIVTLATLDRSYYILTGSGLEGDLPDAICRRIEERSMVPHLKKGEWDLAIVETVRDISRVVYREEDQLKQLEPVAENYSYWGELKKSFSEFFWLWMVLLFLLRLIVNFVILEYTDHREYELYMPRLFRWLAFLANLLVWNPGISLYYKPRKKPRVYYVDNRDIMKKGGSYGGGGGSRSSSGGSSLHSSRSYGSSGGGRFGGGGAGGRF